MISIDPDDGFSFNTAEEYSEEASFLWLQRSHAVRSPNHSLAQLAELDERLEANIDGLRLCGVDGWVTAEGAMADGGPENVFPAAVLALEAQNERFNDIVRQAEGKAELVPGLASALGWVEPRCIAHIVKALLGDPAPFRQALGIAACSLHRKDPGAPLQRSLASPAANVRSRALRAAGELGRTDLLQHVLDALGDRKQEARYWAARSGVLLGDRGAALRAIQAYAIKPGVHRVEALQLALMAMEADAGHALLQQLPLGPESERLKIIGAGAIGKPDYLSWLIQQMGQPTLARLAAEAYVTITGVDCNLAQLEAPPPDDFEDGPTDDPSDEDVDVSEDIALPWLDAAKVAEWHAEHGARLVGHTRLFLGLPASTQHCLRVLGTGLQRQRVAAAVQLCMLRPGSTLFNTAAPASKQIDELNRLDVS